MAYARQRYLANPPVIVGGLPRSGTSLTRDLLNTSKKLAIFDEFPYQRFHALFAFAEQLVQAGGEPLESWRGLDGGRGQRLLALLATGWALASREHLWRRLDGRGVVRVGMKTPLAELEYGHYERLLGPAAPLLVYCWRPPLAVYESLLSLTWGCHYTPEGFVELVRQSVDAALEIRRRFPGKVWVFPVARASSSLQQRRRYTAELFRFVGVRPSLRTWRFVLKWPPVNRRHSAPRSPLAPEEQQARLCAAGELLESHVSLHECVRQLGLDLGKERGLTSAG